MILQKEVNYRMKGNQNGGNVAFLRKNLRRKISNSLLVKGGEQKFLKVASKDLSMAIVSCTPITIKSHKHLKNINASI